MRIESCKIEQIQHCYESLFNALSEAANKGELTYDQHQRKAKLVKNVMKESLNGVERYSMMPGLAWMT